MRRPGHRKIPVSKIEVGPIRHVTLPESLIGRIEGVAAAFAEVDPRPPEEWVEDFHCDMNPEKEIALWEVMAGTYSLFTHRRSLSLEAKKEVFELILHRSMANAQSVIRNVKLVQLGSSDAEAILRYFSQMADAKGVIV